MADTDYTLSDLTEASAINDDDLLLVRQGSTDKKIKASAAINTPINNALTNLGNTQHSIDSTYITSTDTIVCGGYWTIGKLVIVNLRFKSTTTSAHDLIIAGGLPSCVSLTKHYISCNIQAISADKESSCYGTMANSGRCVVKIPDTSYEYSLSAIYIMA